MIDKEKFHVFNYVKKDEYTASMDGMRYMLKKKEKEEGSVLEVARLMGGSDVTETTLAAARELIAEKSF